MTAKDVMAKIEKEKIRVVDLRFVDLPGTVAALYGVHPGVL